MIAIDLGIAQDIGFVGSDAPCTERSQLNAGWSCFRKRGDQYHGTPIGGRIGAGPALATTRLLLGAEIVIDRFALGLRGGWSFRGLGPPSDGVTSITPFGGELTVRITVASSALVRFDLLGIAGGRILDARSTEVVNEDRSAPPPAYQLDNPDRQTLDAYKRMGVAFVGAGVATTFSLGRPLGVAHAIRVELPVSIFFPSTGVAISPTALWVVSPW